MSLTPGEAVALILFLAVIAVLAAYGLVQAGRAARRPAARLARRITRRPRHAARPAPEPEPAEPAADPARVPASWLVPYTSPARRSEMPGEMTRPYSVPESWRKQP